MATAKGKGLSLTASWIIISTVLIGTGLGLYFLLRKPKDKGEEEAEDSSDTGSADSGSSGSGSSSGDTKSSKSKESDNSPSSSSKSTSDIDYVAKSSKVSGDKAKKSYLSSTSQDFVKAWANALKKDKNAFIWSNQVYRSDKGDKVLDYNPLNYSFVAKSGSQGSTKPHSGYAYPVSEGTKLGKARGIDFKEQLWLYLPDNSDYFKWYRTDFIKKSSSSFEGIEYEPTSSFTSQDLDLNL